MADDISCGICEADQAGDGTNEVKDVLAASPVQDNSEETVMDAGERNPEPPMGPLFFWGGEYTRAYVCVCTYIHIICM